MTHDEFIENVTNFLFNGLRRRYYMENKDLYELVSKTINHKKLGKFGELLPVRWDG